jgi:hypothetical protein
MTTPGTLAPIAINNRLSISEKIRLLQTVGHSLHLANWTKGEDIKVKSPPCCAVISLSFIAVQWFFLSPAFTHLMILAKWVNSLVWDRSLSSSAETVILRYIPPHTISAVAFDSEQAEEERRQW